MAVMTPLETAIRHAQNADANLAQIIDQLAPLAAVGAEGVPAAVMLQVVTAQAACACAWAAIANNRLTSG